MSYARLLTAAILVSAAVLTACSGDQGFIPRDPGPAEPVVTLVSGDLAPGTADFALTLPNAGTPDAPVPGPFILHGRNLRLVPELGALAVDLSVVNGSGVALPMPVGLTFTRLLPDSALVLDADTGETGAGAAIVFGFANDDLQWTPGEESLPRTVSFTLPDGGAVAFHALVNVGAGPLTGLIGGVVFDDSDGDGIRSDFEGPLAGVTVIVVSEPEPRPADKGGDDPLPPVIVREAVTGADGRYGVAPLPAGFYAVTVVPPAPSQVTTMSPLYVLLADEGGAVGSFTEADFGVQYGPMAGLFLLPDADTTVRADLASRMNDNYGCDPYVAVGRGRSGEPDRIRGLLRFDLPEPVDGDLPARALLLLSIGQFRDGSGETYHLGVHAIAFSDSLEAWIEGDGSEHTGIDGGCTWVDAAEGVAWVGAGDGGDDNNQTQPRFDAAAAAMATVNQAAPPAGGVVVWDVTALVQAWYAGRPNYGITLVDEDPAGSFRSLWLVSREGEAAGLGAGPRLVLQYAQAPPVR